MSLGESHWVGAARPPRKAGTSTPAASSMFASGELQEARREGGSSAWGRLSSHVHTYIHDPMHIVRVRHANHAPPVSTAQVGGAAPYPTLALRSLAPLQILVAQE